MTLPPHQIPTVKEAFALQLETACNEFETLRALITNQFRMIDNQGEANSPEVSRAKGTIYMALAKSFLFSANRANRICQKNKAPLQLDRSEREAFLKATKPLIDVRDVNEHGFDGDRRSEHNRPSLHEHPDAFVDETGLVVDSPDRILMGPLNLHDVYTAVARMRSLAGFSSL